MARKKTSPFEDLIDIASKLPWWGGVLLAFVSYMVLHTVASRPVTLGTNLNQMGDAAAKGFLSVLAMFGQYILPFAFGTGALISGINSIRQKKVYARVESRSDVAALNEMSWADFERLVGEYYTRIGFQVAREGGNGPDGGIDLVLRQNNETHLVQCKQWKAYKVGVQPVREFYGVMTSRGAAGGYFVTSGVYTGEAQSFVKGLNLQLIDGVKLKKMIDVARKNPLPAASETELAKKSAVPMCPKCGSQMKKRVARQGNNAGKEFWGCIAFPKCKGTRTLEDSATVLR
ncbi:MAG: restriction endonuclease [Proteobacteria bacterium]|nr:restriction endonuclease [Desulfobulbaceae bacterium]MBU4151591.1 restriction endonuclease [Pseudomonadota bacterium]